MAGIAVAIVALLVLTTQSAATTAVRLERYAMLTPSDATCFTGSAPRTPGYDPVSHRIYVPNQEGNISVFNETCHLVGTITPPSGALPIQAAFDPANNYVYVTDYALNQVYAISGTRIVATITGFDAPKGITFDEFIPGMVVVNSGNDQVDVLVGTENFGEFFFTGTDPFEVVFDPLCVCDLVTNTGSDNVTVHVDFTGTTFSTAVGKSPRGMAYDPGRGLDYVANSGSNTVSVLRAGILSNTISGFDGPYGVAWDQSTLTIWVTNTANGKVYEIGGSSGISIVKKLSTASDSDPLGLAYDEFDNDMYVTGFNTNVVYVLT